MTNFSTFLAESVEKRATRGVILLSERFLPLARNFSSE